MNLNLIFKIKINFFIVLFLTLFEFLSIEDVYAQTSYVTWTPADYTANLNVPSGTFSGGTVSLSQSNTGDYLYYDSPSDENFVGGQLNLGVSGAQTFATININSTGPPVNSLTFTFSVPVYINTFTVADIDQMTGTSGDWNDTFSFSGVAFNSFANTNCTVSSTGVITPGFSSGQNLEYASWFNSTTPVTSFTINFATINNTTTAFLAYAIEVTPACNAQAGTLTYN